MDGEAAESAVARVRATLRGPLFERVRRSQRVLREVPLQATLDGKRMRGVVDLAFRDGAGWTLVEYKTSPLAGGPAAQAQARLYGRAFQAVVGEPVRVEVCVVADPAAG
jgi:ATP-dependent exoDNAse (exonuclease V) beta subunit